MDAKSKAGVRGMAGHRRTGSNGTLRSKLKMSGGGFFGYVFLLYFNLHVFIMELTRNLDLALFLSSPRPRRLCLHYQTSTSVLVLMGSR